MLTATDPRRSSLRMSAPTGNGLGVNVSGMNGSAGRGDAVTPPSRWACRRYLCTRLEFRPWDSATCTRDAPECAHSVRTRDFSSTLWRRPCSRLPSAMVSTYVAGGHRRAHRVDGFQSGLAARLCIAGPSPPGGGEFSKQVLAIAVPVFFCWLPGHSPARRITGPKATGRRSPATGSGRLMWSRRTQSPLCAPMRSRRLG